MAILKEQASEGGSSAVRSLKTILLAEIGQQCRFALLAYAGATSAQKVGDAEQFWYSLQSLLQAAANASLLLWPTGESRQALAREIRRALQVTEDSPLSPARFRPPAPLDEWLAEWAASVRHGEASLSNFGPGGFAPCTPSRYVRCFDPDEAVFVFLGGIWDCASLVRALAEIQHQAEAEMERLKAIM